MACNFIFIKKETPTQLFFCEYHKMFEKNLFYETPLVAASKNGWRISEIFWSWSYTERFVWFE